MIQKSPKLVYGLASLIKRETGNIEGVEKTLTLPLIVHPFGLEFPKVSTMQNLTNTPVNGMLIQRLGTEESISGMISFIDLRISTVVNPEDLLLQKLRVLHLQSSAKKNTQYDIFFEVWIDDFAYICGDCDNYTEAGCAGTRKMESIFLLLSELFETSIEVSETPFMQAQKYLATLKIKELERFIITN